MDILIYFLIFLRITLQVYSFVFFIFILLSWFPVNRENPIIKFIIGLCEPPYKFVKEKFPPLRAGMFDFTILYIVLGIYLLNWIIQIVLSRLIV